MEGTPTTLEPWYESVRAQIVRPDQAGPPPAHYLWRRWAPRLGPEAVALLLWIRSRAAQDGAGGEIALPSQAEIAQALGLASEKAARAALRRLEALGFIARRRCYRWDDELRQTVHMPDRCRVAMVDPVAPEDEGRAVVISAERATSDLFPPSYPQAVEFGGPDGRHTMRSVHYFDGVPTPTAATPRPTPDQCDGYHGRHTPQVVVPESVTARTAVRTLESKTRTNVNVRAREDDSRIRALVQDLVEGLHDPGSARFFARVAGTLPEDFVRAALSEARQAHQAGEVRRSPGAMFTDLVKRRAAELGVQLGRAR